MLTHTITVTKRHIHQAQRLFDSPNRCRVCPVALALSEQLHASVYVSRDYFLIIAGSPCEEVDLPLIAINFITQFDKGHHVEPIEFSVIY